MSRHNTRNPIGSDSPLDLQDNAKNFDIYSNSEQASFPNRFGDPQLTIAENNRRAQVQIDRATEAADTAVAAAGAIGPIKFYDTKANMDADIGNIPIDAICEVAADEWHGGSRTRYKRVEGGLVFVVNLDKLRIDLAQPDGVALVGGAATEADLASLQGFLSGGLATTKRAADIKKALAAGASLNIACFGDSTMWGATVGNLGVQDPNNPPKVLGETLRLLYTGTLTVSNNAISGTTLAQMLAGTDGSGSTFAAKIAVSTASVIYCNHCINDSQLDEPIEQYRINLGIFIDLCRKYSKVPILVTPNINPPLSIISEAKSKRLPAYVDMMRDVAAAKSCDLVDNYHYYMQTTQSVSPALLVPDGAHPASSAYAMSGRNMAIPLVAAQVLSEAGDKAGFTNSTYFDTITSIRQMQVPATGSLRFGVNLSGEKNAALQGISLAIILERPTTENVLALYGLQWGSGGTSVITHNGTTNSDQLRGLINQGFSSVNLDWDACILPPFCNMSAGLHIVGILTDTSITGGLGTGFALSGVGLTPRVSVLPGIENGRELRNYTPIAPGTTTSFDFLASPGNSWEARRTNDDSAYLTITAGDTDITATCRGETKTIASGPTLATYRARVRILQNGRIEVLLGIASVTFTEVAATVPNLYPGALGSVHAIMCFQSP